MVRIIVISTAGDVVTAEKVLERIKKKFPKMINSAMRKWGMILERDMKNSLRNVTRRFRGVSEGKGIRWEQGKRSNIGFLFMRREYLALDRMSPHWVSVKRSRSILLRWAQQAVIPNIRDRANKVAANKMVKFSIYVKPHPFISQGFRRARPKLRPILKVAASRGVNA